jgi:membrane associated rhomboid family serine protease
VVIPIHDQNPLRRKPIVTWGLIGINVVVFLTEPGVTHIGVNASETVRQVCHQLAYFDQHAAIPKELVHNRTLPPHQHTVDSVVGPVRCPTVDEHGKSPVVSVLESMFLHGGWLHLLGNMLFLLIFGNNVEDRMGRMKFLIFYLASGYIAAYGFAAANVSSTETVIGASGAIAGVLGAYLVMFPKARVTSLVPFLFFIPLRLPAWIVLGSWFALQALYANGTGVADGAGVAYAAHVVGFIFGALIALAFREHLVGHLSREFRDHHSPYAL